MSGAARADKETTEQRMRPAPGPAGDPCGKYVRETDSGTEITCDRIKGHRGRCASPVGYLDLIDWQDDEIARLKAALEQYADDRYWFRTSHAHLSDPHDKFVHPDEEYELTDGWALARAALAGEADAT